MINDLLAAIKDTSHSCIFDYPDRPPGPLPPPPGHGSPPDCYPYCSNDDDPPPPIDPPPDPPPPLPIILHGTGFDNCNGGMIGRFTSPPYPPVFKSELFIDAFGTLIDNDNAYYPLTSGSQYFGYVSINEYVAKLDHDFEGDLISTPLITKSFQIRFNDLLGQVPAPTSFVMRIRAEHTQMFFPPGPPYLYYPGGISTLSFLHESISANHFSYKSPFPYLGPYIFEVTMFLNRLTGVLGTYATLDGIQIFPGPVA